MLGMLAFGWAPVIAQEVSCDYVGQATEHLFELASGGDADAQYRLGLRFCEGEGVPEDEVEAVKWFCLAAEQGYVKAQNKLGLMYAYGSGVAQDDSAAVEWFRFAADQGYAEGQNNLGWMYAVGRGVVKDYSEAVEWFRLAADQGHAEAQCNLGVNYSQGSGVARDDSVAVEWFRLAADQGDARAQRKLGLMYVNGRGVGQSDSLAVEWYRLAADQGDAKAQSELGLMYVYGRGIEQNDSLAVKWLRLAADQGHVTGQNQLGLMYANGRGVEQNDSLAVEWFRLAADRGHATAQANLGLMYVNGRGVEQNDSLAVKWYRPAAAQGEARAQSELGLMYLYGRGVEQNDSLAVKWLRLAADQGNEIGQRKLRWMYDQGRVVKGEGERAMRSKPAESQKGATTRLHDLLARREGYYPGFPIGTSDLAYVDSQDEFGLTPLHYAAIRCDHEATRVLLSDSRCVVDRRDRGGRTALHWAATTSGGGISDFELFRPHQAFWRTHSLPDGLFRRTDRFGWIPVDWDSCDGATETVELLLAAGAAPSAEDLDGNTPLHYAAVAENARVVELLLMAGATKDAENLEGFIPCEYGEFAHGAASRCPDGDVGTLLHVELRARCSVVAAQEALVRLGYDPGPVDGVWGPSTASAVGGFQRDHDLRCSRELNGPTCDALLGSIRAAEPSTVMRIQEYLSRLGYDPGPRNGALNLRTQHAIAAAKEDHFWLDDHDAELLALGLYVLTLPVKGGSQPKSVGEPADFGASLEAIDLGELPVSHLDFVRQWFVGEIYNSFERDLYYRTDLPQNYFAASANINVQPDSKIKSFLLIIESPD
jgi:TPR repeat protein